MARVNRISGFITFLLVLVAQSGFPDHSGPFGDLAFHQCGKLFGGARRNLDADVEEKRGQARFIANVSRKEEEADR
jgi:hypothetical protein